MATIVAVAVSCGGSSSAPNESSGQDRSSSTVDETSTTMPVGPPPGAELVGVRHLEEHACFDIESDSRSLNRAAWSIDCDQPHSYEIYDILTYEGEKSGNGAPYPGTPLVQDQAERRCYDGFEAFVGVRWTISELDIRTWWPSNDSWDQNDRKILCAVTAASGSDLSGTRRGSKR